MHRIFAPFIALAFLIGIASATQLSLTGAGGTNAPAPAVSVVYQTSVADASNLTTYTYTSQPIGTGGSNRFVVVCAYQHGNTVTVSSITVDGLSTTSLVALETTSRSSVCRIAQVNNANTTGNIVVTYSGTAANNGVGVWAVYDVLSTTPVDTSVVTTSSTTCNFPSLTTSADGAFFVDTGNNGNATTTYSVGTLRYDTGLDTNIRHAGADGLTTGSAVNEVATLSGSALCTGVAASIR